VPDVGGGTLAVLVTPGLSQKPRVRSPVKTKDEQYVVFVTDKTRVDKWAVRKSYAQFAQFRKDMQNAVGECRTFRCCGPMRRVSKTKVPRRSLWSDFSVASKDTARQTCSVEEFINDIIKATYASDAECENILSGRTVINEFLEITQRRVEASVRTMQQLKLHPIANEVDFECAVCLADVAAEKVQLPCGHAFHEDCAQQWILTHPSCPICRHTVT